MVEEKSYTIGELAQVAGVTTRTIRYYVAEEVIPPPQGNGRAAVYTGEHLDRLHLVKILKEEFLPLQEIRTLLSSLDHESVLELLNERQQNQASPLGEANSAKSYLQSLLVSPVSADQTPTLMRHKAETLARDSTLKEATPPPAPQPGGALRQQATGGSQEEGDYWQRLQLAPGVELHFQVEPGNRQRRNKIEQLVKFARQLFG